MKRIVLGVLSVVCMALSGAPVGATNVNDFAIARFDIEYNLSRDDEGRSRLETTETITARFPNYDQNHGIERALPKSYDGHSTSLSIASVTNAEGKKLEYSTRSENGNEILRIGNPDTYVQGLQTYKISYTQRDVTRAYADTKADEFYWDTNGTDWKVTIDRLEVRLNVDDSLASALSGNSACYQGVNGSTDQCKLSVGEGVFTTSAFNLPPGGNVTLAIGFTPGTFEAYQQSTFEKLLTVWSMVTFALGVVGVMIVALLTWRWHVWTARKKDIGTIIPEYLPPKDASLAVSATLIKARGSLFTAQLLDFAVRRYIQIHQTREKSFWKSAEYDIEIIRDVSDLRAEERELFDDIFQSDVSVGRRLSLKSLRNNTGVFMRMDDNDGKLRKLVRGTYELRTKDPVKSAWFTRFGYILLVVAIITLNPFLLGAAIVSFVYGVTLWPLTETGLNLSRYLEGIKLYIGVAEAERLRMLQSPESAVKIDNADVSDPSKLVKLYEKMLPYAVLFGQEKEWSKHIGELYESSNMSPDWYSGNNTAFNAAVFSSAMSSLSNAASYTSASSASSGGSTGGGSSGGGGGGGGGGGW